MVQEGDGLLDVACSPGPNAPANKEMATKVIQTLFTHTLIVQADPEGNLQTQPPSRPEPKPKPDPISLKEIAKTILRFPEAKVCKHWVALNLLEALQVNGTHIPPELAKAISDAVEDVLFEVVHRGWLFTECVFVIAQVGALCSWFGCLSFGYRGGRRVGCLGGLWRRLWRVAGCGPWSFVPWGTIYGKGRSIRLVCDKGGLCSRSGHEVVECYSCSSASARL